MLFPELPFESFEFFFLEKNVNEKEGTLIYCATLRLKIYFKMQKYMPVVQVGSTNQF